ILWNPFLPIYMSPEIWHVLNVLIGLITLVSLCSELYRSSAAHSATNSGEYCGSCGKKRKLDHDFCQNCGKKIN
ncbi:MAG: DUF6804 family protein, partial [bacterium]